MKRFHYVLTLLFVFGIPAYIGGLALAPYVSFSALIPFVVLVTLVGSMWDIWATRHGRKDPIWLWQFNPRQTLGIKLFDLPIEEFLFYVVSSVYVILMWEGLKLVLAGAPEDIYKVIGISILWSLVSILVPYIFRSKRDKISR